MLPTRRLRRALAAAVLALLAPRVPFVPAQTARAADPAGPPAEAARDEAVVRAEIGSEMAGGVLRPEAKSVLPVPRLPGEPVMDGDPSEPFWKNASVYRLEVAGNSLFRPSGAWRISLACAGGALCIAGEREGTLDSAEALHLLRGSRAWLSASPSGGLAKEAGARRARAAIEALTARGGGAWEARLPLDPDAARDLTRLGALRFLWMRKSPATALLGPELRLASDQLSLQMAPPEMKPGGGLVLAIDVLNAGTERVELGILPALNVPPNEMAPLAGGARRRFEKSTFLPAGAWALGLSVQAAGRPVPYHAGTVTLSPEPRSSVEETRKALDEAAAALSELRQAPPELSAALKKALSDPALRSGSQVPETAYLHARVLRRRALLADLGFERFLAAVGTPERTGPYYARHLPPGGGGPAGGGLYSVAVAGGEAAPLFLPTGRGVRDPCVDFEGKRVVFSMFEEGKGLEDGSGFHLWQVDIEGGEPRRITSGPYDDLEPCWMPGREIAFTSTRGGAANPLSPLLNRSLHVVGEAGEGLRRISFNYLVDFTPTLLPDGRLFFLHWVHEDKPGSFINALWTILPDGGGQAGQLGMERAGVLIQPQPIPGTSRVACLDSGLMGPWRDPQAGDIAIFDLNGDRNRFADRIRADRGGYQSPFPIDSARFLAAWGTPEMGFGIYAVDRRGTRELLYRDVSLSAHSPVPLRPRAPPPRLAGAGFPAARASNQATLIVQDVYRGLPGVGRGEAARIRVVAVEEKPPGEMQPYQDQLVPVSVLNRMVRRVLGTAPIHPDGSANFRVPARTSLFLQVLDRDGLMLATMRDVTSFAPGESRSCIGCHEPRSLAPPAVERERVQALDGPAAALEPESGPAAINFARDIQPILDRRCGSCHDAERPAGRVILSGDLTPFFSLAYETLTRGGSNANNQSWGDRPPAAPPALAPAILYTTEPIPPRATGALASPLFELLRKGHHGVDLPPAERALLGRWIDLNLPYYDDWRTVRLGGPGRLGGDGRLGGERRLLSAGAERALAGVLRARCRGCHPPPDLFRGGVLSLSRPELSPLLRAPLALAEGGFGLCGVFLGRDDPSYRAMAAALAAERLRLVQGGLLR